MKPIKSQHPTPITHHPSGISLIALIITIIVIIILAAIVIFSGLSTPDRANLAKFTQSISDFRTAIQQDYMQKKMEYATSGKTRSEAQIYYIIASGADTIEDINEEPTDGSSQYSGTEIVSLEDLGVADKNIEGTYAYQITSDTNVANWKTNNKYYEPTETHWVTDKGDVFVLPGYRTEENGQEKYYLNERTQLAEAVSKDVVVWGGKDDIACPEFKEENGIWNWYIYTPAQLKFLADFVNNGNSLTGTANNNLADFVDTTKYDIANIKIITTGITETNVTKVFLMKDLDLGARIGTTGATEEAKWENNTANAAVAWTPIGTTNALQLKAQFEGNNHTIRGVYVNRNDKFNGIFGNSNTINDLTIKNSYIKGLNCTAGIVGALRGGKVENCHNINTTAVLIGGGNQTVGGIVGQAQGIIKKCTNTGTIIGYGINSNGNTWCGGIAGYAQNITLTECSNSGKIEADGNSVGGIVGETHWTTTVSECNNNGPVTGKGKNTGGVVGASYGLVEKSNNNGLINGIEGFVGGIIGTTGQTTGDTGEFEVQVVRECTNSGTVTSDDDYVGGIVGSVSTGSTITECSNTGAITGKGAFTGGIVGLIARDANEETNSTVEKCYNSGAVNGVTGVGGITGRLAGSGGKGTVQECYNKGVITGTTNVGEIIGAEPNKSVLNAAGLNTLSKLFYLKNTRGLTAVGGEDDDDDIENNVNCKKIMGVDDNLTYDQFKTWITEQ